MISLSKIEKEIKKIEQDVTNCRRCDLWKTRNNPVAGEGSDTTKVMFIGEAPGYNEDMQGRPFVGKAGKILDELLYSVGFDRKEIYIANILKCRPLKNRNPLKKEIKACTSYLDKQIMVIKPTRNRGLPMIAQTTIMTSEEAAKYLRKAQSTLANWRQLGRGPKFAKDGHTIYYRQEWLDEYINSHLVDAQN